MLWRGKESWLCKFFSIYESQRMNYDKVGAEHGVMMVFVFGKYVALGGHQDRSYPYLNIPDTHSGLNWTIQNIRYREYNEEPFIARVGYTVLIIKLVINVLAFAKLSYMNTSLRLTQSRLTHHFSEDAKDAYWMYRFSPIVIHPSAVIGTKEMHKSCDIDSLYLFKQYPFS